MSNDSFSMTSTADCVNVSQDVNQTDCMRRMRVGCWLAMMYQRLLLGIMLFEIPLVLDTYLRHDADDHQFGAVSGFNISLTTFCLGLLYLQWLPKLAVQSQKIRIHWPLTLYVLIAGLSAIWCIEKPRFVFGFWILFQAYLIFVYLHNHLDSQSDVMFVVKFLLVGLALQGAMMIFLTIRGEDIELGMLNLHVTVDGRVTGTFGSPNVAASFLALLLAPALSLFFTTASSRLQGLAALAVGLGSLALILTLSRGGWMATAFSVSAFCLVAYRKQWLSARAFFMMLMIVGALFAGFSSLLAQRLLADDNGSAASRIPLILLTTEMVFDRPLGVGINNWDLGATPYASASRLRQEWFFFVHNKYFLVLGELGFAGCAAFIMFLGSVVLSGWRGLKFLHHDLSPLLAGLWLAFIGLMFHMAVDIFNNRVQIQLLWIVAALILTISRLLKEAEETDSVGSSSARVSETSSALCENSPLGGFS